MNIDKANNIAYVEGKAYYLVPVGGEKFFICEIGGKKYYLGPHADKKMNWWEAKEWAEILGGQLMTREVGIILFKNEEMRKHFYTDGWYWTNDEYVSSHAWIQKFTSGGQLNNGKTFASYVRAIFVE